jgi:hypothetical protein
MDLFYYQLLSLEAPFIATFLLNKSKRSFLFIAALAVVLFVLFGPLALPAFFLALGFRAVVRARGRERGRETAGKTRKAEKTGKAGKRAL